MYARTYGKLTLAIVLAALPAMHAHANVCGEESPLKQRLGEAYYDLSYAPEADKALDEKTLQRVLNATKLKSGNGIRHKCFGKDYRKGADDNPLTFTLEDIEPVISNDQRTRITAWESSKRKSSSTIIDLPEASRWQSMGKNTYSSSELLRRRQLQNGQTVSYVGHACDLVRKETVPEDLTKQSDIESPGVRPSVFGHPDSTTPDCIVSQLIEITTDIHAKSKGLVVEQTYYVNGVKVEWVTWNLDS